MLVATVNESYEDQLRAISCPVELVWGDNDDAAPAEIAARAEAMLVDAQLTLLPDVGHFVPTVAPRELRAAIDRRLAAL